MHSRRTSSTQTTLRALSHGNMHALSGAHRTRAWPFKPALARCTAARRLQRARERAHVLRQSRARPASATALSSCCTERCAAPLPDCTLAPELTQPPGCGGRAAAMSPHGRRQACSVPSGKLCGPLPAGRPQHAPLEACLHRWLDARHIPHHEGVRQPCMLTGAY